MALINCPECGRKVSSKAQRCPNCGLPAEYLTKVEVEKEISLKDLRNIVIAFEQDYNKIFQQDYISIQQINKIMDLYDPYYELCLDKEKLEKIKQDPLVNTLLLNKFITNFSKIEEKIEEYNERYIDRELVKEKEYFDNILKDIDPNIMLDEEQRRAVIMDDNHCLLIAGAGAGKTTTMAAKVKYLVEKKGIRPEEIIVISYTNKAIDELKDRINKKLNIPAKITTFHALGFEIIRKFNEVPPEVNFSSYSIILDILEKTIYEDKQFMRNLILFMGYYFDIPEEALNFKNLNEYHAYKTSQDFSTLRGNLEGYIQKVKDIRTKNMKTITGEFLRSMQEVEIANFLYLNGIDYEYEKPYDYHIPGSSKIYTPDFYLRQGENEAYLEHFGISQDYRSDFYTPAQLARYSKIITDKRTIHFAKGTRLIETWGRYKDGRSLREHLKEELEKNGFVLKARDPEETYRKLMETAKDRYVVKFILFMMSFIEHYKTMGYDENGFDLLCKKTDNERTLLFLSLARVVYGHYQKELKRRNQIDYADMINDGTYYLSEIARQNLKLPYKHIIIDEFQDIARQRFNFARKLSEVSDAKVVAVGDDWQSIFAFAGSDITLFTQFLEFMGSGKEMKITHTYRNSQELIDIAGGFVQKNKEQIQKKLISPKHLKDPIQIRTFDDSFSMTAHLAETIEKAIGEILAEYGEDTSILLIGRYNFDLNKLENSGKFKELEKNNKVKCYAYPDADITFLTAHSSKGLGYDNVIVINLFESKFGFPAQIEDDPIMKLVIHQDDSIPFAEERRLLYVALTRTKNRVYMIAPEQRPSRFLIELIKDYEIQHPEKLNMNLVQNYRLKCPNCGFPLKYEVNKNYGLPLYICTNEPEICDFMTNSRECMKDIFKCDQCEDGYMIVKKQIENDHYFFGCTNYNSEKNCKNIIDIIC